MIELLPSFLWLVSILSFGVFVSASFLNIKFNRKNISILIVYTILNSVLQGILFIKFEKSTVVNFYPIITHLPLVILFIVVFRCRAILSCIAIVNTYLCCQISKWIYLLGIELGMPISAAYILRSMVAIITGVIIILYFSKSMAGILSKDLRTVIIISIMPIVYYVFDYCVTVYTDLLYGSVVLVSEFLPFILCISYLFICSIYFKEYEEKLEAEQKRRLAEMYAQQSIKEIEQMFKREYELSLIRHDMRHCLNNISVFLANEQYEEARKYLKEITETVSQTKMKRFCSNKIVNTVLSFYEEKCKSIDINLETKIVVPENLPFDDIEFTSILSNALENAINAVSKPIEKEKNIQVRIEMSNGKLLLQVKNTYNEEITFYDGMPQANVEGHGLGTQSIKYVVENLGGICQFSVVDGYFVLRVVI